jgi:hypothetical protein
VADTDDFASPDDGEDDSAANPDADTRQKDQPDEQLRRAVEVLKNKDQKV